MNTSSKHPKPLREVSYYRQRYKNRVFGRLVSFFVAEAERAGLTKTEVARRMGKDPAQVTRLLSNPSNLTLETISDFLLALDAEAEPPQIVRFEERVAPNFAHPLIARATGVEALPPKEVPHMSVSMVTSGRLKPTTVAGSLSFP